MNALSGFRRFALHLPLKWEMLLFGGSSVKARCQISSMASFTAAISTLFSLLKRHWRRSSELASEARYIFNITGVAEIAIE